MLLCGCGCVRFGGFGCVRLCGCGCVRFGGFGCVRLCGFGCVGSGVSLVHVGQFERASGNSLHLFGKCLHLGATSLIGWSNLQRKQVAEGIHRDMNLRSFFALGSVVTGAGSALGCGLKRTTVDADGRRLTLATRKFAQQNASILHQWLKAVGPPSALHLLIHRRPGWVIMSHEAPLVACPRHGTNAVEDRPQVKLAMRTILPAQSQIRQHKRPFLIRYIARTTNLTPGRHPSRLDSKQSYAKNLDRYKLDNSPWSNSDQSQFHKPVTHNW
jgi:hypothetical protein